jgi:hypothetical protein
MLSVILPLRFTTKTSGAWTISQSLPTNGWSPRQRTKILQLETGSRSNRLGEEGAGAAMSVKAWLGRTGQGQRPKL